MYSSEGRNGAVEGGDELVERQERGRRWVGRGGFRIRRRVIEEGCTRRGVYEDPRPVGVGLVEWEEVEVREELGWEASQPSVDPPTAGVEGGVGVEAVGSEERIEAVEGDSVALAVGIDRFHEGGKDDIVEPLAGEEPVQGSRIKELVVIAAAKGYRCPCGVAAGLKDLGNLLEQCRCYLQEV